MNDSTTMMLTEEGIFYKRYVMCKEQKETKATSAKKATRRRMHLGIYFSKGIINVNRLYCEDDGENFFYNKARHRKEELPRG